ncbi:MAG: hemolysin III family protein [Merdibacter sp.]
MICMFTASALYHAMPAGSAADVLHIFDHICIYLAIAGSYTRQSSPSWMAG